MARHRISRTLSKCAARTHIESMFFESIKENIPNIPDVESLQEIVYSEDHLSHVTSNDFKERFKRERYHLDALWMLQEERALVRTECHFLRKWFLRCVTSHRRFDKSVRKHLVFFRNIPRHMLDEAEEIDMREQCIDIVRNKKKHDISSWCMNKETDLIFY